MVNKTKLNRQKQQQHTYMSFGWFSFVKSNILPFGMAKPQLDKFRIPHTLRILNIYINYDPTLFSFKKQQNV